MERQHQLQNLEDAWKRLAEKKKEIVYVEKEIVRIEERREVIHVPEPTVDLADAFKRSGFRSATVDPQGRICFDSRSSQ